MNLAQVVQYIKNIALEHPLVKSFYEGDPTVYLNSKEIKYGAFILTQTAYNNVVKEQGIKKYTFDCVYADRLTEDGSNRLVVQTDGINVIHEIFNYIKGNSETSNVDIFVSPNKNSNIIRLVNLGKSKLNFTPEKNSAIDNDVTFFKSDNTILTLYCHCIFFLSKNQEF